MDIARIRKKAKEKEEKGKAAEDSKAAEESPDAAHKAVSPGELVPEISGETDDEIPFTPGAGQEGDEVVLLSQDREGEQGPAGTKGTPAAENGVLELLTFSLANEEFAFRVSEVEEIIRFQRITRVPTMQDYVRGITSLRGKIIPVIDLNARLALKGPVDAEEDVGEKREDRKILILSGPKGMIGATVDKVLGVIRFPGGTILDPPAHLTEDEHKYIEGVVILEKRFISIVRSDDALDIEFT
jgi:purine-binding chemotaxis protein CheW